MREDNTTNECRLTFKYANLLFYSVNEEGGRERHTHKKKNLISLFDDKDWMKRKREWINRDRIQYPLTSFSSHVYPILLTNKCKVFFFSSSSSRNQMTLASIWPWIIHYWWIDSIVHRLVFPSHTLLMKKNNTLYVYWKIDRYEDKLRSFLSHLSIIDDKET